MSDTTDKYLPQIDAARGAMAMWVFIFHASVLCGFNTKLIPPGPVAVDVFMFISGFLMTRNFINREHQEPLSSNRTWLVFWVKRFFRIAPVYYPSLFVSLLFWRFYTDSSTISLTTFPPAWSALLSNDPSQHQPTLMNIAAHLSFIFGLFPQYANNNALPDWSLSLEMQFYLAMPFILLAVRRFGLPAVAVSLVVVELLFNKGISYNLVPDKFALWPQPSLLPLKINCFMTGVAMAIYLRDKTPSSFIFTFVLMAWRESQEFIVIVLFCFLTLIGDEAPFKDIINSTKAVISGSIGRFFGDISYPVYLTHTLVLLPISTLLLKTSWFVTEPPAIRFSLLFGISALIVIPLSYLLHLAIERPGINLGRLVMAKWYLGRSGSVIAADSIG